MSRRDVVSSLLRSTARSAAATLKGSQLASNVRNALSQLSVGRVVIPDPALTRAVARVPDVAAATVHSTQGRMRFHLSFEDGSQLVMALMPAGAMFAPGGAKELSFAVEPREAVSDLRSHDVVSAIAGEIARALWRPALMRAKHSDHGAFVASDNGRLVVDLRTVPEVRWALSQRLPKAVIEALRPRGIEAHDGRLLVLIAIDRIG
jgi:hypothetical protein